MRQFGYTWEPKLGWEIDVGTYILIATSFE